MRFTLLFLMLLSAAAIPCFADTVVLFEKTLPPIDNGAISRTALERALAPLSPRFVSVVDLQKKNALKDDDLLVFTAGSALPTEAWETIRQHLDRGNLLVLGGRPFFVPVRRDSTGWAAGVPQNTYARSLGILHSYVAPLTGSSTFVWDDEAPWFHGDHVKMQRVFVNAGHGGRYRGLGYLIDSKGNRIAAPIVADDLVGFGQRPRRRVYLSFDAEPAFWESTQGIDLMRQAAVYASRGGIRMWVDLQQLSLEPGGQVSGAIDVVRSGEQGQLTLEILSGSTVLASRTTPCGTALHEELGLTRPLTDPGLYRVRARLSIRDTVVEQYTSGVVVRDRQLLTTGERLTAGRDFFRLDGTPSLLVGANYFSTDPYTSGFFVGGSLGGNAWRWDQDFAEMARQGFNAVRTGTWLNRIRYVDDISGAADERLLGAIEAYLSAAARHHMQVIFTFFAFDPQTVMQKGQGQEGDRVGPGSNPYLDPVAIEAQLAYVRTMVSRFRDVPFLSYDLINEPSFSNPRRLWKGNSPNNDPAEVAAWHRWLEKRYGTIERLGIVWRTPPGEFSTFEHIPLPGFYDLELVRADNPRTVRAVDYNLFAQHAFRQWVDTLISAIRMAGSHQAVTVGQDEGGVADRVLNQFWGESHVDYTVNHTWWRDDALLWSSVAAKTVDKPNLIGETGPQPVWSMDGSWRWDDVQGLPLVERKLALGFANANAGVLHWDWAQSDTYGLLRRDGSQKVWMSALAGIAEFARSAQPYATEAQLPEVAFVLPQSLQLSTFGSWGVAVQQNAIRALYHHARSTAFAVGEYQLSRMPDARLIIVPAPWVLHQDAWDQIMTRVRSGATLLISGRVDADEHWLPIPRRTSEWDLTYSAAALTTREAEVRWPEGVARLSYSGDKTTYAERGVLKGGKTFSEIAVGKGKVLYCALPLELADQLEAVGRIYRYAMKRAGVRQVYETSCEDPGLLICPTRLQNGTLYVITSESSGEAPAAFRDALSGKGFSFHLAPGRAALLLVSRDGRTLASYNVP